MRKRVEDLGRLYEKLNKFYEDLTELQDNYAPHRPKDYAMWWSTMDEEKRAVTLSTWVYSLDTMKEDIVTMIEIASGDDILNRSEDNNG